MHVGDVESRDPLHGGQGGVAGPAQRLGQGGDGVGVRSAVEAADPDVDRVDGPAADGLHDQVARALEAEAPLHRDPVPFGQLDRVGAAEEVGCVEQVDVEGVALDPFAAVEQPAEGGDPARRR